MGKVVPIEGSGAKPRAARARRRSRSKVDKTALVLGGGGFTGGVYEIGALRALDLLAVNSTVNEFDVYVGTSAGSFVASMTANGVTPEEMMRVLNKALPSPIADPKLRTLLRPNYMAWASRVAVMPLRVVGTLRHVARNIGEVSMVDVAMGIAEGLPTGVYNNHGLERYMAEVLSDPDRSNDFRELRHELLLTATDVDTCERLVLGKGEWDDVPISRAVAASTALPMVYEPIELRGRQLMDGGIGSTTNVDVAVDAGAKFIIVVNPLVPYINDFETKIPTMFGSRVRRVSDMGLPGIANQAFRLMAHARLQLAVESWQPPLPRRGHHPDRARARRRADVRDLDPRLLLAAEDRQARLRVGDPEARARLPALQAGRGPPRDRHLRPAREEGPRHGRGRGEGRPLGLAPGARADHGCAAAPVRPGRGRSRPVAPLKRKRRCTSQGGPADRRN